MGLDRFFGGLVFGQTKPIYYLAIFDIRSPSITHAALVATNERGTG